MTYIEKIIDITTGEEIIRPYTEEEIAAVEAHNAQIAALELAKVTEQNAKIAARQAVLDKLGLTAEEIAVLLA